MSYSVVRLKILAFNRLSQACLWSDRNLVRSIIGHLPKSLLGEFLLNMNVLTLDAFDRLLIPIDTRNYWRLHLCRMTLCNAYWLQEIDRFLACDQFDSKKWHCSEKQFYFKVHFYCHIFYERDLLVRILDSNHSYSYLNSLCVSLKILNRTLYSYYVNKKQTCDEYYGGHSDIRRIIDELESTLWLSYVEEISFDNFERTRWLKFIPYWNYFRPIRLELFLEQPLPIGSFIEQFLYGNDLCTISIISKHSLRAIVDLLIGQLRYVSSPISHLSIELMNGDYSQDSHVEFNVCYLIERFSRTLISLELKRISFTSRLLHTLDCFIDQLTELSLECTFSLYRTFHLLYEIFHRATQLKQLTLRFIARQYWTNECTNQDEPNRSNSCCYLSTLRSIYLNNFRFNSMDLCLFERLLLLPTITRIKLVNIRGEDEENEILFQNLLFTCLIEKTNLTHLAFDSIDFDPSFSPQFLRTIEQNPLEEFTLINISLGINSCHEFIYQLSTKSSLESLILLRRSAPEELLHLLIEFLTRHIGFSHLNKLIIIPTNGHPILKLISLQRSGVSSGDQNLLIIWNNDAYLVDYQNYLIMF